MGYISLGRLSPVRLSKSTNELRMRPLARFGLQNRHLFALDLALLPLGTLLSHAIRFEGLQWPLPYPTVALVYVAVTLPIKIGLLLSFGVYRRLWRFASVPELETILVATGVSGIACFTLGAWLLPAVGVLPMRVPLSILALDALITSAFVSLPRLQLRTWGRRRAGRSGEGTRRVLIAGAGVSGGMLVTQLANNPQLGLIPIGFVDDDPEKQGCRLHGLPVLGALRDAATVCRKQGVAEILIAMPAAAGRVVREVVQAAAAAKVRTRTLPSISELMGGRFNPAVLRQVQIEDLLRREPVRTNLEEVGGLARGETVMVTGAGGSIGSELCRQLARLDPARVVLLGHGENSIFAVTQELTRRFPGLRLEPVIADVKDEAQMDRLFERYGPYSVFHAAAHKHVPLMEVNACEAVANNVLGTRNVVQACSATRVAHLVLVSTDKAVRPTSVMGATKRVAEQIVQHAAEERGENFVVVRFGNVLGSRGSVVPVFLQQIADGGPVTVTHPEMRRYFMTIPEAVQLVLQAGALGKGGEVFVLDMGEPIKILDLATDLIRLAGREVGRDIEIRFSGARPGERLYEELFFGGEHAEPTSHTKVLRAKNGQVPRGTMATTDELIRIAQEGVSDAEIRDLLRLLVPDFDPRRTVAAVTPKA